MGALQKGTKERSQHLSTRDASHMVICMTTPAITARISVIATAAVTLLGLESSLITLIAPRHRSGASQERRSDRDARCPHHWLAHDFGDDRAPCDDRAAGRAWEILPLEPPVVRHTGVVTPTSEIHAATRDLPGALDEIARLKAEMAVRTDEWVEPDV